MGLHIANLVLALDPEFVVIGGGLMDPESTTDAFRARYLRSRARDGAAAPVAGAARAPDDRPVDAGRAVAGDRRGAGRALPQPPLKFVAAKDNAETLTVEGREVRVTNPDKPYFSREAKLTKLELVRYYLAVADGALAGIRDRPDRAQALRRRRRGRAVLPEARARQAARLAAHGDAVVSVGPHRRGGGGRRRRGPRVDRQPRLHRAAPAPGARRRPRPSRRAARRSRSGPGRRVGRRAPGRAGGEGAARASWACAAGRRPAARAACTSTCASQPRWTFTEVRRAALALSREIERRAPTLATSKWWKEERHGVFLDYNQNAKDRTTCSAYSVRPLPDARVSAPLTWDEVAGLRAGRLHGADDAGALRGDRRSARAAWTPPPGSLDALLELAARDEAAGLGDAPWPPHFRKMDGRGAARRAVAREEAAARRRSARRA